MTHRIRISQTVMDKAGAFGLQDHDRTRCLAAILKQMARLSAIASGNFNTERRRYGVFILTIRAGIVVDINCNEDGEICVKCLGTEITPEGEECACMTNESQV